MQTLLPRPNNLWFQNCFSTQCSDLMSIHAQNFSLCTITVTYKGVTFLSTGMRNYAQVHNFSQILKPGSHRNLEICVHERTSSSLPLNNILNSFFHYKSLRITWHLVIHHDREADEGRDGEIHAFSSKIPLSMCWIAHTSKKVRRSWQWSMLSLTQLVCYNLTLVDFRAL